MNVGIAIDGRRERYRLIFVSYSKYLCYAVPATFKYFEYFYKYRTRRSGSLSAYFQTAQTLGRRGCLKNLLHKNKRSYICISQLNRFCSSMPLKMARNHMDNLSLNSLVKVAGIHWVVSSARPVVVAISGGGLCPEVDVCRLTWKW